MIGDLRNVKTRLVGCCNFVNLILGFLIAARSRFFVFCFCFVFVEVCLIELVLLSRRVNSRNDQITNSVVSQEHSVFD